MAATILIVEDNELNMELFADLLEDEGYQVLRSADGLDGFRQARELRPDLIVMDIQLPTVSGLEVTRWLKEEPELSGIPVLAVTAFAMKGDETRMLEGGCQAYMAKPISVGRFLDTIRTLLAARDDKAI